MNPLTPTVVQHKNSSGSVSDALPIVGLTAKGRAYVEAADRMWGEAEDRWAASIGSDRLDRLHDDLRQYVEAAGDRAALRPAW
jgi:hypothetical protein